VPNYVEPFAGSLAVLLSRPHAPRVETVNDLDAYLTNFWRALQADPEAVARYADWPVNENDLHARHLWLVNRADFAERMTVDPDYYDAKIAGWWVWGICQWIGTGWCHRKLPHVGDAGRGVHRKLPHMGGGHGGVGRGITTAGIRDDLTGYMLALSDRLRRVRVACGDWKRVTGNSVTWRHGVTGVLLDPPYDDGDMAYAAGGKGISAEVRAWAIEAGKRPDMRIALCGYEGEHDMPEDWRVVAWKAKGGYGGQNKGENVNAKRERIWFSPACLVPDADAGLFGAG